MAEFNPQIKTKEPPSYLKYSNPISQPRADMSLGLLFEGVGDVLRTAVEGADFVVKDIIEKKATAGADAETEANTAVMEGIDRKLHGAPLDLSVTPGLVETPERLKNLERYATNIQKAIGSGRAPELYYRGRILELAKSLRTQYPGYRQYIDQTLSRVTGMPVANAYVDSLLSGIAASSRGGGKTQAEILFNANMKELRETDLGGHPQLPEIQRFIIENKDDPNAQLRATQQINSMRRGGYEVKARDTEMKLHDTVRDSSGSLVKRTELAGNLVGAQADRYIRDGVNAIPLRDGRTIDKIFQDFSTGVAAGKVDSQAAREAAVAIRALMTAQKRAFLSTINQTKDGVAPVNLLAGKETEANKIWDERAKVILDFADMLDKGETSAANLSSKAIQAQVSDDTIKLMTRPEFRRLVQAMDMARGNEFLSSEITRHLVAGKFGPQVDAYMTGKLLDLSVQPDPTKTITMNDTVSDIKAKQKDPATQGLLKGSNAPMSIPRAIDFILDPKLDDQSKFNIIASAFSKGNQNFLDLYPMDRVVNGKQIPGKYTVLGILTKPAIAAEVKRLGGAKPDLYRNYKDWVIRSSYSLYKGEVQSLKDIVTDPNTQLVWNVDSKRFEPPYRVRGPRQEPFGFDARREETTRIVNRVNSFLSALTPVLEEENVNVEDYLVKTLQSLGVPTPANLGIRMTSESGDSAMLRAIINAKMQEAMKGSAGGLTPSEKEGLKGR